MKRGAPLPNSSCALGSRRSQPRKLRRQVNGAVLHSGSRPRGQGVPELVVSELDTETLIRLQPAIERVATAVTAFVGRALKGPVDQAVSIASFDDYQRIFGGLWQPSTLS